MQAQHQRGLLSSLRRIRPDVNDVFVTANISQAFKQPHIGPHTHHKGHAPLVESLQKLMAHKAGIHRDQRLLRQALGHLLQVLTLAGIAGTRPPIPRQPQAHVIKHRQPNLWRRRLLVAIAFVCCLVFLLGLLQSFLMRRLRFFRFGFCLAAKRFSLERVRGVAVRLPSPASSIQSPTRKSAQSSCMVRRNSAISRPINFGSNAAIVSKSR